MRYGWGSRYARGREPDLWITVGVFIAGMSLLLLGHTGASPAWALIQFVGGLAAGGAIAFGLVLLVSFLRRPAMLDRARARAAFEALAQRYGGATVDGTPRMLLRRRGWEGRLELVGGFHPHAEVSFAIEGVIDGVVQVRPETAATEMLRNFGVRDLSVGDSAFDSAFRIAASKEGLARAHLTAPRRELLLDLNRRMPASYRVAPSAQVLRVEGMRYDINELDTLVATALQLFDQLQLGDREAIEVMETSIRRLDESLCGVCGSGLAQGRVVRCAKCRTPHHEDCWSFNGRCATYACGESEVATEVRGERRGGGRE